MDFPDGFEWDWEKRKLNIRKHGVDFSEVVRMFRNPIVLHYDQEHSEFEDGFFALGYLSGTVYHVVFVKRGSRIRVITARRATREEEASYYNEYFGEPDRGRDSRERPRGR